MQSSGEAVPRAQVIRPVSGGVRGRPFAPGCGGIPGYVSEELFLDGEAIAYRPADGTDYERSGHWDALANRSAPFRTRMLVVRPADARAFSGTVVVNWQNVTRGFEMGAPPPDLKAAGLAWVGVSAQQVGHSGFPASPHLALKGWDPERYRLLNHPGDDFSFDIFSQTARVLGPDRRIDGDPVDPMGGLPVERLLAMGSSQSALRLRSYINAVQPATGCFAGFLLTLDVGRGAILDNSEAPPGASLRFPSVEVSIRGDLDVPVMVVNSESEAPRLYPVRQPDTDRFRLWEIAGSAHISYSPDEKADLDRQLGELGVDPSAGLPPIDDANAVPHAPVVRAALRHTLRWLEDGVAPPCQTPIAMAPGDPPEICRDEHGNAIGGVRLPDLEVPLGRHCGLRPDEHDILARISGLSVAFPRVKLEKMYSGPSDYLARHAAALDSAISSGVLVEEDGPAQLVAAKIAAARHFSSDADRMAHL